jgi:hypothetical protein
MEFGGVGFPQKELLKRHEADEEARRMCVQKLWSHLTSVPSKSLAGYPRVW